MPSPLRPGVTVVPRPLPADRPVVDPPAAPAPQPATIDVARDVALISPARPLNKDEVARLTRQWSRLELTAQDAHALKESALQIAPTLGSDEARAELQKFLQEKVPSLVRDGSILRDFRQDLRVAAMADGRVGPQDADRLIAQWKGKKLTTDQAQSLTRHVLSAATVIEPGSAREKLQHFLESDLPRLTVKGDDDAHDFNSEIGAKLLGDGKLDEREVKDLARAWGKETFRPKEAEALKNELKAAEPVYASERTRAQVATFVDKMLPKLILDRALTKPHNVKLTWTPPFANVDGTPLTNLGGYRVLYGPQPGVYDHDTVLTDPSATGFEIENLASGTWYFTVKSRTTDGTESAPATEVSKTIQ